MIPWMSFEARQTAGAAGLGVLLTATGALGAGPDAVASELFRQGRALIKQAKWDEGCPKLEASMKRFPAASTQLNLALCAEEDGRVATAWAMARRARVLNRETVGERRRQKLDEVAEEIVARLEPRLPRLRVSVPGAGQAKAKGGGGELPLGVAVPLDPGPHDITVSAPGHERVVKSVTLEEGETMDLEVELPIAPTDAAPETPPRRVPETVVARVPTPRPEPLDGHPPSSGGPPLWTWLTGGAGLALAGFSVGFAVDAVNVASDLEARCGDDLICDEDLSFDPASDNRRKNVSTGLAIGFGAGSAIALTVAIVGLAVGADEAPGVVGWAGPAGGGLGYQGAF